MTRNLGTIAASAMAAVLLFSTSAIADDRFTHELKLKKLGLLTLELPPAWGRKPKVTKANEVINVSFNPVGTRREPVFSISMDLLVSLDDLDEKQVEAVAKTVLENYRGVALESDIPIIPVEGDTSYGFYFTLTDKEKKPREYQYLTLTVVYTNRMIITSYFLSNDGAPDFGADALHMMRTSQFVPVPEKD